MKPEILTASYLFSPEYYASGIYKCFYCGLSCDGSYTKSDYVKKTFTNRDIVKFPGSSYVCGCCVQSLATLYETKLIDGEVKKGKGGAPRTYSWCLTLEGNTAFSKKHLYYARSLLKNPPHSPFSIVIATSGKKQIIFRSPVNYQKGCFIVQFEEDQIAVQRDLFQDYLLKATKLSAAVGKKALTNPDTFSNYLNVVKYYGGESILTDWVDIYNKPMAQLAAWVCKGKKDARDEFSIST